MTHEKIKQLFGKYYKQEASEEEVSELMEILQNSSYDEDMLEYLKNNWEKYNEAGEELFTSTQSNIIWGKIHAKAGFRKTMSVFTFSRVAAAIILLASSSFYFLMKKNGKAVQVENVVTAAPAFKNDVMPGKNKAILTLGDGSFIMLDSVANGKLAMQGNTSVNKLRNGEIVYAAQKGQEVYYNSLSTPKGGHYKIKLPDGSVVWLNAASSLRYPTAFTGSKRAVEMQGEAYFEVAKNAKQPFVVKVNNGSEIEVLGTHFNVMAYAEEKAARTTLLEGAVKINNGASSSILRPGQQASIEENGKMKVIASVNTEETTAWKNEQFNFNSTDIHDIMKQIARWYDVTVEYKGNVAASLNGNIKMDVPLSEVLKILELAGNVKFGIEGKKIIVSPGHS